MPATRALAFAHGPARVVALAQAFAQGCRWHGVPCEVRRVDELRDEPADVVWHYGLGEGKRPHDAYAGKAVRIIGDAGYWRNLVPHPKPLQPKRHVRVSVETAQLGELMNRRAHPADRFDALRLKVLPVSGRGESILVTGRSGYDAKVTGMAYGEWERATVYRLQKITDRPIVMREKPKNPPIEIPGVARCAQDCTSAIRSSWAVVCRSGNIGADAILHGVPVFAEFGPGALHRYGPLEDIDRAEPLSAERRKQALADIAYWQWTTLEIERGELWQHLKDEGVI